MTDAAPALTTKTRRRYGRPDNRVRRLGLGLPGLDLRTPEGRRYSELIHALLDEFPGVETHRLRELAVLKLSLEQVQVEVVCGSSAAREDMVRIGNIVARREAELRLKGRIAKDIAPASPTLAEIAARHNGGAKP